VSDAFVERTRLRTWQGDVAPATASWRIVLRFALLSLLRKWYLTALAVGVLVMAVSIVGVEAVSLTTPGETPGADNVMEMAVTMLVPGGLYLLLVGAPSFAEDLRFNAPLFYFSRPLTAWSYFKGKSLAVAGVVATVSLVPIVAMLVVGTALGAVVPPTDRDGNALSGAALDQYRANHLAGLGDWLLVCMALLPAVLAVLTFLTSAMLVASAYTKRAWHAGMAAVAGLGAWGLLGASATFGLQGAWRDLFGPFGWMGLVLERPLSMQFSGRPAPEGSAPAVAIAYALLLLTSYLACAAAARRIQRMEAQA